MRFLSRKIQKKSGPKTAFQTLSSECSTIININDLLNI